MLLLSACDRQQATIERSPGDPRRAVLRLQLPLRPDLRGYRDWTWVACPITLPPTVPAGAVLHLPALRITHGEVCADLAFTHAVPAARRAGHVVAIGVDWDLNTLLSAGAARLHQDGTITVLGAGAQYRVAGVLAKQHRLRRHGERLHAKASRYDGLIADDARHPLNVKRPSRQRRLAGSASAARTLTTPWPGRRPAGPWTRPSPPGPASSTWKTCDRWKPSAWAAPRSKTGPTRNRVTRPAPRRREAPSPARPPGCAGQHPHPSAPATRGSTWRGIPPPRARNPTAMGNDPA